MHAALGRVDVICKRDYDLVIAVVVLQGDLGLGVGSFALHVDYLVVQRRFVVVYERNELADAAGVAHLVLLLLALALVLGGDVKAAVEEGLLAHARVQRVVVIDRVVEHPGVGLEADCRAGAVGFADDAHLLRDVAARELHLVDLAVFVDVHDEPLAHCVYDRCADAVQAAGHLVASAAELAAGVQHGENDLERALAGLLLDIHGDAAAVIAHADNIARLDDDLDAVAVAGQRLVDGVIDDLVHKVVQTRRRRRADVHARTLSDRLKPFEHLDLRCVIFLRYLLVNIRHFLSPFIVICSAFEKASSYIPLFPGKTCTFPYKFF